MLIYHDKALVGADIFVCDRDRHCQRLAEAGGTSHLDFLLRMEHARWRPHLVLHRAQFVQQERRHARPGLWRWADVAEAAVEAGNVVGGDWQRLRRIGSTDLDLVIADTGPSA